jgi:hypothetical protein
MGRILTVKKKIVSFSASLNTALNTDVVVFICIIFFHKLKIKSIQKGRRQIFNLGLIESWVIHDLFIFCK